MHVLLDDNMSMTIVHNDTWMRTSNGGCVLVFARYPWPLVGDVLNALVVHYRSKEVQKEIRIWACVLDQ